MDVFFSPVEADLAAVADRLRSRSPSPALFPHKPWTPWDEGIQGTLTGASAPAWPGGAALRAGLLLWNDALEASHALSQGIENPTGAYWHGIMHRREGDLANAGYWFRRVGRHPVMQPLYAAALGCAPGPRRVELERGRGWDPFAFLRWCGAARAGDAFLEAVQVAEIELLLAHCYAGGGV